MLKTARFLGLLMVLAVSACTPTVLSETAQAAFEDRITEDQVTDLKIASGLLSRLAKKDKNLVLDISVDVWEQRMLLTGTLDNRSTIDDVIEAAREDGRIKVIYNEIRLVSAAERDERRKQSDTSGGGEKTGIKQTVNDYWIETKIKGQLLTAKNVTSVNYRWRSVKNAVQVIGRAGSDAELTRVLDIIRATKGVTNVKHFVEIK
ncbi:MAG: BON domain-containing protein [Alphaproteobacteria bacterium]